MTIANGQAILAADLNALWATGLASLRTDNAGLPLGHELAFSFAGIVATTPAYKRKAVFVAPVDSYLETLAVQSSGCTAASTVTVTLAGYVPGNTAAGQIGSDSLTLFPVAVGPTASGAARAAAARVLYQGGRARADAASLPFSPAFRTLLQGAAYQLTVATTSVVVTTARIDVALVLRTGFARPT